MSEKKVLILTGSDIKMHNVLELTIPSKKRYAKKYNYDFIVKYSFDDEIAKYNLGLGFARFISAFNYLDTYDIVMWVDADSIITNDSYSIDKFINETQSFYASYDWLGYNGFSSGNFIITKNQFNELFFNEFLNIANSLFKNHEMAEQITLNYMNGDSRFCDIFCILDHKFLNSVPRCVENTSVWQHDPVRTGPNKTNIIVNEWTVDSFLAHLTGCSNEDRVDLLLTYFKDYL